MTMAQNRSDKLKRLVSVQRHLEKMAEIDLANTTRQREEVSETMEIVAGAINSLDPIHRSFSRHYSGQYSKLQQQDQMLANVQQMHEMRVVRERTKGDRMEEHRKEARNAEEREAADNSIYDLIDQHIAYKGDDD
jgi:GTP1/Obg family GTP-binding protein